MLVIEGKSFEEIIEEQIRAYDEISVYDHYMKYIEQGMDTKEAMKLVAKERGIAKRDVYAEVLAHKE